MRKKGKSRHHTPRELREDNVTSLELGSLSDYMNKVSDLCEEITKLRRNDPNQAILIQAGTRAIPLTPRQPSNDEVTILPQRQQAASELLSVVDHALSFAKKSRLKFPQGKSKADGISLKEITKIIDKAHKDYAGDISRVVDMVRCTILAGDVQDLQTLSEIFRPCANPNVVRYRNEFNRVNPGKGDIRRLQVNVALPNAEGHVAEILIFYGPSAEKYEQSRAAYGRERAAKDAVIRGAVNAVDVGYKAIARANKYGAKAARERSRANAEAADFPEVRSLVMNQQAYLINGFPVIVSDDAHEGKRFALVPDPKTGFWETDQRFLEIIESTRGDMMIEGTTPLTCSVRAEALCRSKELQEHLRAEM